MSIYEAQGKEVRIGDDSPPFVLLQALVAAGLLTKGIYKDFAKGLISVEREHGIISIYRGGRMDAPILELYSVRDNPEDRLVQSGGVHIDVHSHNNPYHKTVWRRGEEQAELWHSGEITLYDKYGDTKRLKFDDEKQGMAWLIEAGFTSPQVRTSDSFYIKGRRFPAPRHNPLKRISEEAAFESVKVVLIGRRVSKIETDKGDIPGSFHGVYGMAGGEVYIRGTAGAIPRNAKVTAVWYADADKVRRCGEEPDGRPWKHDYKDRTDVKAHKVRGGIMLKGLKPAWGNRRVE